MKCFAYDEDKIVLWDSGASLSFIDESFRNRLEGKLETVKDSSIYKVCLGDGSTVETKECVRATFTVHGQEITGEYTGCISRHSESKGSVSQ